MWPRGRGQSQLALVAMVRQLNGVLSSIG